MCSCSYDDNSNEAFCNFTYKPTNEEQDEKRTYFKCIVRAITPGNNTADTVLIFEVPAKPDKPSLGFKKSFFNGSITKEYKLVIDLIEVLPNSIDETLIEFELEGCNIIWNI